MNLFNKLFKKSSSEETKVYNTDIALNLSDIQQFTDIWIKINNNIYEGWVIKRDGDILTIVYCDNNKLLNECTFKLTRPYNRSVVEDGLKTLYLKKP